MFKNLLNYFTYTKSERNGTVVLLLLLATLLVVYITIPYFSTSVVFSEEEKAEVKDFMATNEQSIGLEEEGERELFLFNPNSLSVEKWKALGLSEKQIRMVHKYEEKGGSFQIKSDVGKIYAIDSALYLQLYPYIDLPKTKMKPYSKTYKEEVPHKSYSYKKKEIVPFDINTADTMAFKSLVGIGVVLSGRIIKYRNLLGGFYSINQLTEVYGIEQEVIKRNEIYLMIDSTAVKKINLNSATKDELAKHPYISWKEAKLITAYHTQHGDYNHTNDLLNIVILDELFVKKVTPYLVTQ